jgi:hypothetical protein
MTTSTEIIASKFSLGQVVATTALVYELESAQLNAHDEIIAMLRLHASGNWGVVCDEDKQTNEYALKHGERILSRYEVGEISVYVITEWDRSATTIMRVEDY